MEEFYRLDKAHVISCSNDGTVGDVQHIVTSTGNNSIFHIGRPLLDDHVDDDDGHDADDDDDDDDDDDNDEVLRFDDQTKASDSENNISDLIKTQIAKHPGYPDLVAAYIECQKVGAPPETASLLEEIGRENHVLGLGGCSSQIGADPELDNFMESYREILQRFKDELSKPFDEATMFLSNIQSQLNSLCEGASTKILEYHSDETTGTNSDLEELMAAHGVIDNESERPESSEQDSYGVGAAGDHQFDLKEMLLKKYSGYLTMLKSEFLKKRKKVELPKPARAALLRWWNDHYIWPYPTEEEKAKLSAETGLDQKQINNWFVNQRKRHWKPSENIKSVLVESALSYRNGPPTFSNDIGRSS